VAVAGPDRPVAVCRELTKKFEEVITGTVTDVLATLKDRTIKGECVVLIGRGAAQTTDITDVKAALTRAMQTMRIKDAATAVAGATGLPRRDVYQMALDLKDNDT